MVDVAFQPKSVVNAGGARKRSSLRTTLKRKSTAAFLMTLPLILLIVILVLYPALYSLHLATLNKSMQHFVGLGNFEFLFKRETFWLVVKQSCIFAISAVIFKALIGFIVAHFVHNIPAKGQRKWRGMLLVPWVISDLKQSCIFAISAVIFKALIGFIVAHFVHNIPAKGQRKWRGMLLVPWVIPPAMSTLAWLWLF